MPPRKTSNRRRKRNPLKKPELPADIADALRLKEDAYDPKAPKATPELQAAQDSADKMAVAGDATTPKSQMDRTNADTTIAKADALEAQDQQSFDEIYDRGVSKTLGYLQRRRTMGNRTGMVPPNCERHDALGEWGLLYRGKWMMIRWLDIRQRVRQKRFDQGYQYFEGKVWCERLGLVPENYLNERGRVGYMDSELAWVPEEYIFERRLGAQQARDSHTQTVRDKLSEQTSSLIPTIEVLEGDDESVKRELKDRKRFPESRS